MFARLSTIALALVALCVRPVVLHAVCLPQEHLYQLQLRSYLATLTEQDFVVELQPFVLTGPVRSNEDLHRLKVLASSLPEIRSGLRQPAAQFTLASIESESGIRIPPIATDGTPWLAAWSCPGSPYRDSRALKLRVFATAAVDLIMHDYGHEKLGIGTRSDFLGGTLIWLASAHKASRGAVPPEAAAYAEGLEKLARRINEWGPTGAMTDMDLFAAVSMRMVSDLLEDPEMSGIAQAYVNRLFTEPRFFHPAGYFVDGGCFDTAYNGISLFFSTWAALQAPDWPFVRDAVDKACRLKSYLAFPDPDGNAFGPSQCSSRTSADPPHDQVDFLQRNLGASMFSDHALFLTKLPAAHELQGAEEQLVAALNSAIEGDHTPAQAPVWGERHWVARNNYAYDLYVSGYYDRRARLEAESSPLLQNPYAREGDFIQQFDKAFLIGRLGEYGFAIHTGPVGGDMHGWGGGELCAFWTSGSGSVMLGRRRGWETQTHQGADADTYDIWRLWPVHAVTGLTAEGSVFSSSRIADPRPAYTVEDKRARVRVEGLIPRDPTNTANPCLKGRVRYAATFIADASGPTVETSIGSDGTDRVTELYETIPVFLRETSYQASEMPTGIEFRVGNLWREATPQLQAGANLIKLTRFTGAVLITFAAPVRAKLSPEVWADHYQTRANCRTILVDLLSNAGVPVAIPVRRVRYTISALGVGAPGLAGGTG